MSNSLFFFTVKTVQRNFGNSTCPIQLHMKAQEAFTIFYSKSFPGRSKIENLVILNACYLPIYSLATPKSYPDILRGVFTTGGIFPTPQQDVTTWEKQRRLLKATPPSGTGSVLQKDKHTSIPSCNH